MFEDIKKLAEFGTKAGLGVSDTAQIGKQLSAAPKVNELINKISDNQKISQAEKDRFIKALGDKWKGPPEDRTYIQRLNSELQKDPSLGRKLESLAETNPNQVITSVIPNYTTGNLGGLVTQAPVQPAQTPTAPTASTSSPAANPAAGAGKTQTASPSKPAPTAPAQTTTQPVITAADLQKELFKDFVSKPESEIAKMVTPEFVKDMAAGLASVSVDKFGADEAKAQGFVKRVEGDPKLQESIANNLKEHPGFVRNLAKMANDDSQVPDSVRQTAKKELERIMEKPELLASDDYVNGLNGKLQMAGGLNKFASMFENMFGVDMKGMMSNVGEFFQGFIQKIMDFIGNLTGNPNMVSGSNMALGMTQNLHHSMYEKQSMRVLPDERGQLFHEVKNGNSTYKEQNTIEVQGANGTAVRVIPTDGAVKLSEKANGEVRLRVAASYDDEGRVRYTRDVSLSKEGYEQYKSQVAMRGANEPVREPPKREPMQTAYLDPKSGMEVPDPTIKPQQQGPGYTDPNLTAKMAQNPNTPLPGMNMGLTTS